MNRKYVAFGLKKLLEQRMNIVSAEKAFKKKERRKNTQATCLKYDFLLAGDGIGIEISQIPYAVAILTPNTFWQLKANRHDIFFFFSKFDTDHDCYLISGGFNARLLPSLTEY